MWGAVRLTGAQDAVWGRHGVEREGGRARIRPLPASGGLQWGDGGQSPSAAPMVEGRGEKAEAIVPRPLRRWKEREEGAGDETGGRGSRGSL